MIQDRSYVLDVPGGDVNMEKCVSEGAESPRADAETLSQAESFPFISLLVIFSRSGPRTKS